MGNLREKLGLRKPKVTKMSEPIPPPPPKPKPGKPLVFGTEWVTASCGHPVLFEIYDPAKDKYREQRRLKVTDRICPACREAQQAKVMAEAKERRRLKKLAKKHDTSQRLPDGASFHTVYEADLQRWQGTLTVRTDAGATTFVDSCSGVFGLLTRLDRQFKAFLNYQDQQDTKGQDCSVQRGG